MINLLIESENIIKLQILDLSNSEIYDRDLQILAKDVKCQQFIEIYIDNCKNCSVIGVNHLNLIKNLTFVSAKFIKIKAD